MSPLSHRREQRKQRSHFDKQKNTSKKLRTTRHLRYSFQVFTRARLEFNDMKTVIPGGSGQVGSLLARAFVADGHDVVVLSRNPRNAPWRMVTWDGETVGSWKLEIDGADLVINLAGRSVNCRYSPENRRL